jgi:hypothetical protein
VDNENLWFFSETLQQCRICLLDNGELVIVPRAAQCGDVICILSGTVSACALRFNLDNSWSLISGDCYLFNQKFMHPVAYEWFVSDDYIRQNQDKVQVFRIR